MFIIQCTSSPSSAFLTSTRPGLAWKRVTSCTSIEWMGGSCQSSELWQHLQTLLTRPLSPPCPPSNLGAWFGLSLDCELHTWAHLLKKPLLCVSLHTHTHTHRNPHTHKHCSFSGNGRFENSQLSLPLSPVQTASVKSAFFLSINISQWRHRVRTALSVQRGVRSTRWSWKVNIRDLHQVPMFYFHSCVHIILPKLSKVLLHAKCTNNANRSYHFIIGIVSPKINWAKDLCCPRRCMCFYCIKAESKGILQGGFIL